MQLKDRLNVGNKQVSTLKVLWTEIWKDYWLFSRKVWQTFFGSFTLPNLHLSSNGLDSSNVRYGLSGEVRKQIGQALGHFLMTYLHIYDTLPATFCANFVSLTYGFRATFFKQKLPKLDSEFPILCFKFKNSMKNWKKKDSCIHQINHDKLRSCAWDSNPGRKELKDPLSYYGPLLESNTY